MNPDAVHADAACRPGCHEGDEPAARSRATRAASCRLGPAIAVASRVLLRRSGFWFAALGVLSLALATFATAQASTLEQIRQRGYMVVATQEDFPPFEYRTSRGVIGFDNELLLGLRTASGLEIRHKTGTLCEILAGVASGKYDVAATAVAMPQVHLKQLRFTRAIADLPMAYVKRQDDQSIVDATDLAKQTVGVLRCSAAAATLAQSRTTLERSGTRLGDVIEYDNLAEAYQDLVSGHIRAVINNRASVSEIVRETSGLLEAGTLLGPKMQMAWAVQKRNDSVLAFINTYLERQRASGSLTRLRLKYGLLDDPL